MSQGDYLKHKINSHILKSQTELPNVLNSRLYTEFMRYQIANSITNTNNANQQLDKGLPCLLWTVKIDQMSKTNF